MITSKEDLAVKSEPTMLKKNIIWHIDHNEYVVRNVPYVKVENEGEEFLDMDVSITLTALRDLMVENQVSHDVDYEDFAHIKF